MFNALYYSTLHVFRSIQFTQVDEPSDAEAIGELHDANGVTFLDWRMICVEVLKKCQEAVKGGVLYGKL